ncbi:MAG TPA: hypothetical protein VGO92_00765, partial [Acidimicrobiales bacterium]|nr:hypothetical protein [Acidimicrobiales bacterium]
MGFCRVTRRYLFARIRIAAAVLVLVWGVYPTPSAQADDPPPDRPPPTQIRQTGYNVDAQRPPELLPKDRGPAQDHLLDIANLGLQLPDANALGALRVPQVLPPLSLEPPLNLNGLVGDLKAKLPPLDLRTLRQPVTGLLGTVGQLVGNLQATATAVAAGLHSASTRVPHTTERQAAHQPAVVPPVPPSVEFRLTTTSGGVTQTFVIPLCTPTPINVVTPGGLPPTTLVSLCPVPMAFTTAVLVPPPGQPFQLYLSVQRIAGSPAVSAQFNAAYDVPNANGPSLEVRFGLDSGSSAYPANGIVGAATDYNPLTNSAAHHLTMGWATDGPVGALTVEAVGVGRVRVSASPVPAESGSLALSYVDGQFNAQMTRTAAPLGGSNPTVSISAPVPNTAAATTADLTWTYVPQNFTFSLRPDLVNGRPTGVSFDGSQTMGPNALFAVGIDYLTAGQLSARLQQQRLGSQFSEKIATTQDESGNPTGVSVDGSPGALSTLAISTYAAGALGAVVELVDIPATEAHFTFHMKGTGTASLGASISGSPGPAFVGAVSYYTALLGGTASATPQITFTLATGAPLTVSPPVAIPAGVKIAASVSRVNPNFAIELDSYAASSGGTGVDGFKVSGSTTGAMTADQILIDAQADLSTRARVVMNALSQSFEFKANLHGTTAAPTGLDVTDSNVPAQPSEYKQIHVTGIVSGSYQPLYTFAIQRGGSNTSGAAGAAPKSAVIFDPPDVFDASIDYATNTAGGVCHQTLNIAGSSAVETNGSVVLSAGDLGLTATHVFVQGHWTVSATTSGPALTCAPDNFAFHMHQDAGGNPAGVVTASQANVGRVTLRSFATTSNVSVQIIRDHNRTPTGARIDGNNSEANPGQQVSLEQMSGSTTTVALNLWAAAAGSIVNGTQGTAVVYNVPQAFGISTELQVNPGQRMLKVESYNAAPAPAETMVLTAPAGGLAPGGTIRFVLRSFDTHTEVHVTAPDSLDTGTFQTTVHNSNANPNLTEAIGIDVRDGGGTPVLAANMSRPNGDTSGFATSAYNGALVWQNMPQVFDITLTAKLPPTNSSSFTGGMELRVQNAGATPASSMVFTQPYQHAMLAVEGMGIGQHLRLDFARDLCAGSADLHAVGTMPDGFQSVQLESLWGGVRDAVFSVYKDGPFRTSGTTNGTNVFMYPASGQRSFDFHAKMEADDVTLQSTADVPGQRQSLSQYFYSPAAGSFGACVYSGYNYPCTRVDMDDMPQKSNLHMVSPSPECTRPPSVPHLDYSATDSNLRLTVDSLIPCLGGGMAFYGMPAHGISMEGALGDFCNEGPALHMKVTPGFGEVMPYIYIDGWNIHMPVVCSREMSLAGPPLPPGVSVHGVLQAQLNYVGNIAVRVDPGLTEIQVVPVQNTHDGKYFGLEGVMAKGNPNARFIIGLGFGLGPFVDSTGHLVPSSVDWQWEATGLGVISADSDFDHFNFPEDYVNYGDGWISSYAWEAFANNTNRYQLDPGSCAPGAMVNPHTTLAYSPGIPFDPPFSKVNNGIVICGGHVGYYQINPQNLAFRHCSEVTLWICPGGTNTGATSEWS